MSALPSYLPPKPPYRGTIIVDSCSLIQLALVPLSVHTAAPNNTQSPPRDYLSSHLHILHYLAQQGYRIIIPEMVAYEVGDNLFSPLTVDVEVKKDGSLSSTELTKLQLQYESRVATQRNLNTFLTSIAVDYEDGAKEPGITVLSADYSKSQPACKMAEDPYKFVIGYRAILEKGYKMLDLKKRESFLKREAAAYIKRWDNKKDNFGEYAIEGILADPEFRKDNPKTFVLSNDKEALTTLSQLRDVPVMNNNGLLDALTINDLHSQAFHAPPSATFADVQNRYLGHLKAIEKIDTKDNFLIDNRVFEKHEESTHERNYPFCASLEPVVLKHQADHAHLRTTMSRKSTSYVEAASNSNPGWKL